jgi:hypothetical protein
MRHEGSVGETLGRILDPGALDACTGPHGRLAIEVPRSWEGDEIDVAVPPRVACARCEGGGCDACERRGGHRIPGEVEERTVRLRLPSTLGQGVVLRLVRPFEGAEAPWLEQLLIEARPGPRPSANVTRIPAPPPELALAHPTALTPLHDPRARRLAFALAALAAALLAALAAYR